MNTDKINDFVELSRQNAINLYNTGNQQTKDLLISAYGRDFLAPKDITERCNSIEALLEITKPTGDILTLLNYTGTDRKMIGAKWFAFGELIADALNEGTVLTEDDKRWAPFFRGSGFSHSYYAAWGSDAFVGSRLGLKNERLSDHAGKTFPQVYLGMINK